LRVMGGVKSSKEVSVRRLRASRGLPHIFKCSFECFSFPISEFKILGLLNYLAWSLGL
jgi:hypothetical protein